MLHLKQTNEKNTEIKWMIRRVGGGRIDGRMDGLMQRQWLDFEWIDGWVAGWLDEG